MEWITAEEVKAYATTPKRAMDISVRHHQQNVDATEEELDTQNAPFGEELCGLCWYYKELRNGGCDKCPLLTNGNSCHASGSLYQESRHCYLGGDRKAFIKAETALLNKLKSLQSGAKSMDKKKKLEIQIAQNEKDQEKLREVERKLKARIADAEVTYSIGDRFKIGLSGKKYMLVSAGDRMIFLAGLADGCRYTDPHQVDKVVLITPEEFKHIRGHFRFTRYWNQAKQEEE